MSKTLMKGNEAIGLAAIKSGCLHFFGYPITPQNEIPEYLARELPKYGGVFIQAESEVSAINMVYGASGAGARVMTSSSSPGIALKQEGISYIVGAELPCLIVNMMRGGPGLGGIQPAQSDYFQATRGGGNGDYYMPVFAPASVQESVDLVQESFDIADQYRTPVMMLMDGMIGQIMEPVEFREHKSKRNLPPKDWASTGTGINQRKPNVINSLYLNPEELEQHNHQLFQKFELIRQNECCWEEYYLDEADLVIVAYGTTSRIVKNTIDTLQEQGIKIGMIRPITLWPFPYDIIKNLPNKITDILVVEMSMGQMIEDVLLGNEGRRKVHFYGRTGGMIPEPKGIIQKIQSILNGE